MVSVTIVTLITFAFGYLLGTAGTPAAFIYWARNIFGVALILTMFFGLTMTIEHDHIEAIACLMVSLLMVVCYVLTHTSMNSLLPTWFAGGWVQLIVGSLFALFALGLYSLDDD